jgi:hypothetical protein
MSSSVYSMVAGNLEPIVGDILANGIIKIGLKKVGANPETTTPEQMKNAIDVHICEAVKAFMGKEKAVQWAMKIKDAIDKDWDNGGE